MKPSERIRSYISVNSNIKHPIVENMLSAMCAVLDEQIDEKKELLKLIEAKKYVCPNCHRIVDELIGAFVVDPIFVGNSILPPGSYNVSGVKRYVCKYCVKGKQ